MLAEDVMAQEPIPAVPTSIMDGYAVVAEDGAGEFDIVGGAVLPSIVSLARAPTLPPCALLGESVTCIAGCRVACRRRCYPDRVAGQGQYSLSVFLNLAYACTNARLKGERRRWLQV